MNLRRKQLRAIVTLAALVVLAGAPVHAQQPPAAIPMAPGVLVSGSGDTPIAWIADARGQVAAIRLDDGAATWRGPAEGLPLALFDQQLVVLGRPARAGQLSLQLLDPASGEVRGGLVGELPAGVLASPDPQPNRSFVAQADTSSGTLRIRWSHAHWPLRGAATAEGEDDGYRRQEGAVSVDFASLRVAPIAASAMPAARTPDLSASERLAHLDGTQFRAADDATVQVSTAQADAVLGTRWRWSLHERSSGRALGNLTLPQANAPFLLSDSRLLWRAEPLTQRQASGDYFALPVRLVAQHLGSGRELWSVELLDHRFLGTLPP